mgnify:CR=1 FL=1
MFREYTRDELRQLFNGKTRVMGMRLPEFLCDEFDALLQKKYGVKRPEVFRALMEAALVDDFDLAELLGKRVQKGKKTKS